MGRHAGPGPAGGLRRAAASWAALRSAGVVGAGSGSVLGRICRGSGHLASPRPRPGDHAGDAGGGDPAIAGGADGLGPGRVASGARPPARRACPGTEPGAGRSRGRGSRRRQERRRSAGGGTQAAFTRLSFRRDEMTAAEFYQQFRTEAAKAVVGQEEAVRLCAIAVAVGGHVLLEGVPGTGKTLLAKTVAPLLRLDYARIPFTPPPMPADIAGTAVYDLPTREFRPRKGPGFTNLLLADESRSAHPLNPAT